MAWEGHAVGNGRRHGSCLMSDMRREGLRLALEMGRHHMSFHSVGASRRRSITVLIVVVVVSAAVKVGRAFVLVRTAVILVLGDEMLHVCRGVFIQLLVVAKDEDSNIDGAQDGELVGLLE